MIHRARHRLRMALVVVLCLLFQQVAVAAYVCPVERMPPEMAAMAHHFAGVGMQPGQDHPARGEKHCAPELTTADDHVQLSVPALMLPPVDFAPVLATPVTHVAVQAEIPIARSDPPPRLRFCSLLI